MSRPEHRTLHQEVDCPKCSHKWFPRGNSVFKKCPNCGNKLDIRAGPHFTDPTVLIAAPVVIVGGYLAYLGVQFFNDTSKNNPVVTVGAIGVVVFIGILIVMSDEKNKQDELEKERLRKDPNTVPGDPDVKDGL